MNIYVIVVYSLNERGEYTEMHNYGWFSSQEAAEKYMELAGQPVPGRDLSYYDDPFEQRWSYVLIEKVSEGVCCDTEIVANYKAEWYLDEDYVYDDSVTEFVNKMRQRKFRIVKMDKPAFDDSHGCNFSGF